MTEWTEPDWAHERLELRRFILHRLRTRFCQVVDDRELDLCAQDAWVSLFRWWCHERDAGRPIESLEAMKNRVASFAAVDFIRSRVQGKRFVPIEPSGRLARGPEGERSDPGGELRDASTRYVDAPERLRSLLLVHFQGANQPCYEIAQHYFAGRGWQVVATEMSLRVDTVKQRWSRCVKAFREFLAEHPECEDWVFEEMA